MKTIDKLFDGYENTKCIRYDDDSYKQSGKVVKYKDLPESNISGMPKACFYGKDGELTQVYTEKDCHMMYIAMTGAGKTTSGATQDIISAVDRGMPFIAMTSKENDCAITAGYAEEADYNVKIINLKNPEHSECYNPKRKTAVKYERALNLEKEVELIETENGFMYSFMGNRYNNISDLDTAIERERKKLQTEVQIELSDGAKMITAAMTKQEDRYWGQGACTVENAISEKMTELFHDQSNPMTVDKFSYDTELKITDKYLSDNHDGMGFDDKGFFSSDTNSRSYQLIHGPILDNAPRTRSCILDVLGACLAMFRNPAIRRISSCSTFDLNELVGEKPIAIYIIFPDDKETFYPFVSMLLQDFYNFLIEAADKEPSGRLKKPFYIFADEFGNLPPIPAFRTSISVCRSRNIFWVLFLQSYSQLNAVYGKETAQIIKDNIACKIFMGSNDRETLEEFSAEAGMITRISPLSALNGNKETIGNFQLETIRLVSVSALSNLKPGECIVTEANCPVMFSKIERYFLCKEFENLPKFDIKGYKCSVDPYDERYNYDVKKLCNRRNRSFR